MNLVEILYVHPDNVAVTLTIRSLPDTTNVTETGKVFPEDELRSAVEKSVYSTNPVEKSQVPITVPILATPLELLK